jgi:hypothetical protein
MTAVFGWMILVALVTWLVLGEYYRLTAPREQVIIMVPPRDEPPPAPPGGDPGPKGGDQLPTALGPAGGRA